MRVIPFVLAAGLAGPAAAASYQIDLSTIDPIARAYSCPYCQTAGGPLFPVMDFNPGDTVDFGSVTLAAHFDGHDWSRAWMPTSIQVDPLSFWAEPAIGLSFDPGFQPTNFYGGAGMNTFTFDLTYTIPSWANSIQIGWGYGDGVYAPPAITAAFESATIAGIPEPTTWAMLLLGFVLMLGKRTATALVRSNFMQGSRA